MRPITKQGQIQHQCLCRGKRCGKREGGRLLTTCNGKSPRRSLERAARGRGAPLPKGADGSLAAVRVADSASPKGEAKAAKKAVGTRKRECSMTGDPPHKHLPSKSADNVLIKEELKNYPNAAPFKHKPQAPLLIAQLLSQLQPTDAEAGPSAALTHSHMPQHAGPVCSTSRAHSSQPRVGAGSIAPSQPSWHSPSALAPACYPPEHPASQAHCLCQRTFPDLTKHGRKKEK